MKLPNYFMADLPVEAILTPAMVREACLTLKRNRAQYLAHRSTRSLIETLGSVARDWLSPEFPLRQRALLDGPEALGFSVAVLTSGLVAFFSEVNTENLERWVLQELGHKHRLDSLVAMETERQTGVHAMVTAPELIAHFTAGNIPNPTLMSMIAGFLTKSAQFLKCARGSSLLPRLFAHSIYERDPKLASCLELVEWPGGQQELESVLIEEADCVTATGNDETIAALRQRVPPGRKFLGYGHRVSFAYIARERLTLEHSPLLARAAARDIAAWDQWGCLSPHVIYVERGGGVPPARFAQMLAEALDQHELAEPRGKLSTEAAAHLAIRREFYKIRADASEDTRVWASQGSTAWTVVFEEDSLFQMSCLNRFIYVKAAASLEQAVQGADQVRSKVSTVGLAVAPARAQVSVKLLAAWGASRVCPIGHMQRPPLAWRHDGRPALAGLVSWTEWEKESDES